MTADAINAAFDLKGNAKVSVGLRAVTRTINAGGQLVPNITSFSGAIVIPNVSKEQGKPLKYTENKVIGEGGNGGKYIPPAKPSPGTRGSLQPVTPGVTVVAAGMDALGDPSEVMFGLDGVFVGDVFPTTSMTLDDVLAALALQLNQHDEPAIFDQTTDTLFLVNPVPDGAQLDWGNTDVNFEFVTTFDPVPEPASAALVLGAVLAASLTARMRGSGQR